MHLCQRANGGCRGILKEVPKRYIKVQGRVEACSQVIVDGGDFFLMVELGCVER